MRTEYKHPVVVGSILFSLLLGISMLFFHIKGYDTSIGWSLTTESELEEVVAYGIEKGPFEFNVQGEKITLTEAFYGDEIFELKTLTIIYVLAILIGLVALIASASYFKQWGFLVFSILFALFLTQLDLPGFFGIAQWIILIPFVILIGIAYLFQSYFSSTVFAVRLVFLAGAMFLLILFIPEGLPGFTDHFLGYGIIPLMVLVFLFLAMISEEIIFGLLFLLTRTRGSKGNEKHFSIIGGIYIVNLAGYYLNKANLVDFTFTFLNPYALLFISFCIALWSYRFKYEMTERSIHFVPFLVSLLSMGIVTFALLGLGFAKGIDGIPEGIHYLVVYTHLAFGFMFLAYIILNFINPLINGYQIYKVVYKKQNFHYVTARLGGLAMIAAFYLLSSQAAFGLFRSAKYSFLGDAELKKENVDLAISYYKTADFYGYNTHYPNYQLGTLFLNKNDQELARNHFEKASTRHPSAQSYLNSSNLQRSTGLGLSTAILEQGLLKFPNRPELINNLGIIKMKSGLLEKAFDHFNETQIVDSWNQAPQANKWAVLSKLRSMKGQDLESSFLSGNPVVKTNVMSALMAIGQYPSIQFDSSVVSGTPYPLQKQAYLLNASLLFADTTVQNQIDRELSNPVAGIQGQLSKSLALNLYKSGKVKSSFLAYDQLQLGKSGAQAGMLLNEVGMLALDQNAPLTARDFFDRAIEKGNVPARMNKLVALLEAKHFDFAQRYLEELIASDTMYLPLPKTLVNVFRPNADTTIEARINQVYYRASELAPSDLIEAVSTCSPEVREMIIFKLSADLENDQNQDLIDAYAESELQLSLPDYRSIGRNELVEIAREQPFNEKMVLLASEYLSEEEDIDAYNFLHEMVDFNPYSIPLLKAFALKAIDINLPEYAQPTMITLSHLMTSSDYIQFQAEWYQYKAESTQEWPY